MKEYKIKINSNDYNVVINEVEGGLANVEVNGVSYKVEYEKPEKAKPVTVQIARPVASTTSAAAAPVASGNAIVAPLPGVIIAINVKVGDTVKRGQSIMTLEAMKMENSIEANADGKVIAIKANIGDSVLEGAPLIVLE